MQAVSSRSAGEASTSGREAAAADAGQAPRKSSRIPHSLTITHLEVATAHKLSRLLQFLQVGDHAWAG